MNYQLHYDRLIERARNRTLDGYKESHHVIPRCMNGTDDKDNLVELTAREHFIAHLLLMKIYPKSYGLIRAVNMMCIHQTENRSMNRMYGWLKEKFSESQSKSQSGEDNSQYGTRWCHNPLTKENRKLKRFEEIEEGWLFGKYKEPKVKVEKQLEKEEKIKRLTEYYKIYSEVGFKKFVEITGYKFSQENLVSRFKNNVKEFVPQNGKKRGI